MQEKSETFSEFLERSDLLAEKIGLRISDFPKKIGISTSMFYLYRSGKHPISRKVWLKLEQAELAAGIKTDGEHDPVLSDEMKILEDQDPPPVRLDRIEASLERLTLAVEKLVKCFEKS